MSERELPVRASLENLRKQAKALHRAFRAGDADAMRSIRQHLPKAGSVSDKELRRLDVSLQETQHVLAKEYGHGTWDDLKARIDTAFEAVAELPKDAQQALLRVTERDDWIRAISVPAVPERVRESILSCMSRRAAQALMAEQDAASPSAASVQEAQARILEQVRRLAADGTLEWPPAEPATAPALFDELARLTDREAQALLREVAQLDLNRALIGASEAVRGRMLGNMSRRVRSFIVEEGERLALDLPDHEPGASRQRILEWAEALGRDQRIAWPPPADREPHSGMLEEPGTPSHQMPDPLGGLDLEDLSIDDLARIYGELTSLARREGMLALEEVANGRTLVSEGLRLAVDGTDPALVESMLKARTETVVRNRRLRLTMMREGILALQGGTNPQLIWHQMQAHYLDPDEWQPSRRLNEAITGTELRDWVERGWLSTRTPADIAELFMHLGFTARNEGIQVLQAAAAAIEHPLLKAALASAVEDRDHPEALQRQMQDEIDAEVRGLEARTRAVIAGVLGVMAGKDAQAVGADVRVAAASVDEAAA